MNKSVHNYYLFFIILFFSSSVFSQAEDKPSDAGVNEPQAAVASAHPLATAAGIDILNQGGNAFDAAIAVTATLAVVEPYSSGIGGGGFYLLHEQAKNRDVMIDARELAPIRAFKDMYLDDSGKVVKDLSITGALSAGIPGIPAALVHLAEKYGELELSKSLAAAIKHAKQGFTVDEYYQRMAGFRLKDLQKNKAASELFLYEGEVPELGYNIVQNDLADTLERIATSGFSGFYEGELAWQMVRDVRNNNGIWTLKDLATYELKERSPQRFIYKGMRVTTAALPSSGGLVIAEILAILSEYDLERMSESQRIHHIVEAMRRAYRDRAEYMGDPDFIDVPINLLVSELYVKTLAEGISRSHATPSSELKAVAQPDGNGTDTTHFSIVDKSGNRVSATLSINYPFGSCFVVKGTGVLLNDEMDDFSAKPGVPNAYGLVGSHANAIEPGKRMLSSMTPTIVETKNRIAIIGTPGGSRIITMVLLGILDFYEHKSADEIVNAGRYHHQYLPDQISFEPGSFDEDLVAELEALGHRLNELNSDYGNMQLIIIDKDTGEIDAASDERGVGRSQVIE